MYRAIKPFELCPLPAVHMHKCCSLAYSEQKYIRQHIFYVACYVKNTKNVHLNIHLNTYFFAAFINSMNSGCGISGVD